MTLQPDENSCKKCGKPVRYAVIGSERRGVAMALDAKMVNGGPYLLEEIIDEQGIANGRWQAVYIKVADRDPKAKGFRSHDCKPSPAFDQRDMTPVLVKGVWTLVHRNAFKS